MPHREPKPPKEPEHWVPRLGDYSGSLLTAIGAADLDAVKRFLRRNPTGLQTPTMDSFKPTWLHEAVAHGSLEIVDFLLQSGMTMTEANAAGKNEKATKSLVAIAASFHPALVRSLLERGADPHLDRPIISAVNLADEDMALNVTKALVEAGVDVNKVYDLYGDMEAGFTALEFAGGKPKVQAYLRSVGAVDRPRPAPPASGLSPRDEVTAYFDREFGPVDWRALTEIVATTDPPIAVHIVHPNPKADYVTLFTNGLSGRAMDVPEGGETYRFAELFLQLPADWPLALPQLARPKYGWPVALLRNLGGLPHGEGTWLGLGVSSVTNGDPPEPVGPGLPFTATWLIAERSFVRGDGETVQLYRVVPLTTPERDLLMTDGAEALGDVFDTAGVGMAVDPDRRSAV